MNDPLIRPDPADADIVPPGERAALADVARDLVVERESLAETARELVKSNVALTDTVADLTRTVSARTRMFAALLVLDAFLTLAIVFFGYRYEKASTCQAGQNDAFRSAIIQRNDAAAKERAAQRHLFDVVLNPGSDPATRLKASQDYYAGLIAADQQRAENPFPTGNCS